MATPPALGGGAVRATVSPSGETFACETGRTLLMAGLRAGLNLPYECASGACGTCRCKLVTGEVETLWPEAPGLSDRDRRRGNVILMCQSRPLSDVVIDVRVRPSAGVPLPSTFGARIAAVRELTHDMVFLRLVPDRPVSFLPGQFVLLDFAGRGRRAYSMANVDPTGSGLDLVVKHKPGGRFSETLCRRTLVGDRVTVEGPYGGAYYRPDGDRPVVGIAGGSGLAPIWSIAQAASEGRQREVHLYFGVNAMRDACFREEFAALARTNPRLKTNLVVRDDADPTARGGLVGDVVLSDLHDLSHADVYLAGPPAMIDAIMYRFVSEGSVDCDRVFFDRFS